MRQRSLLGIAGGLILSAGLEGSAGPTPPPGYVSEFIWEMQDPLFGGFSALAVSDDGARFTALSDRGAFTEGVFTRDRKGAISAISAGPLSRLRGAGTAALPAARADSEGIAIGADGSTYISFEGVARVLRYPRLNGPAEAMPIAKEFARMKINAALEALAIDAEGTLFTLPERSGAADRPFPVFRFRSGTWDSLLAIPRHGAFLPVAADFGPDGRFYLLERSFRGLPGFANRLRRFEYSPKGFSGGKTLFETPSGLHDNLEGLSVWRDAENRLRATMISDDNFNPLQNTEIVEYLLPD